MAGGLATRLRPITEKIPKGLVEINGIPFLEYQIKLLRKNEIKDIVLCIGYKGEMIEESFGDGKNFGVNISYSKEIEPLGTGGAIIKAFNKSKLPLVIIGDGPERKKLKQMANPNISLLSKTPDSVVEDYMSRCRAFIYAGIEDFGIAPVEALASGAPVIAYGKGGIMDTVNCIRKSEDNKIPTGIIFNNQTSEDIFDTVDWFEDNKIWKKFNSENLNHYSYKFSPENFKSKFESSLNNAWNKFKKK